MNKLLTSSWQAKNKLLKKLMKKTAEQANEKAAEQAKDIENADSQTN